MKLGVLLMPALLAISLTWQERAPLPMPRAGYMAGVVNNRLVIAGGTYWKDEVKRWTDRVDIFDPSTNVWLPGAPLPEPRGYAASVSLNGRLYVFGGGEKQTVRRDALVFENGKWRSLAAANLPAPRLYAVAIAIDNLVYVLGGVPKADDDTPAANTLWVWNSRRPNGGWEELPPLPGPARVAQAAAAVGGKIYVFGGYTGAGTSLRNLDDAYQFDLRSKKWTKLPNLAVANRAWWAVAVGNKILVLGGYTDTFASEIYEFDPPSGVFREVGRLPHALADVKFFRLGASLIGAGGEAAHHIRGAWTLQATLPPGS